MVFLLGNGVGRCCHGGNGRRGGRPDGAAELLDCRFADGAGNATADKDDLDVLDSRSKLGPGEDSRWPGCISPPANRAEVAAACQNNGGLLAGEQADIVRRHRHAHPNDLVDIGLEDRRDRELEHWRADYDVVAALSSGRRVVRDLDGGGAFRRMLLTRREGAADPGKIDEWRGILVRSGRQRQRRVRGFPLVDENRGELSGGGELMARLASIASRAGMWGLYVADCLFLDLGGQMIYKREKFRSRFYISDNAGFADLDQISTLPRGRRHGKLLEGAKQLNRAQSGRDLRNPEARGPVRLPLCRPPAYRPARRRRACATARARRTRGDKLLSQYRAKSGERIGQS